MIEYQTAPDTSLLAYSLDSVPQPNLDTPMADQPSDEMDDPNDTGGCSDSTTQTMDCSNGDDTEFNFLEDTQERENDTSSYEPRQGTSSEREAIDCPNSVMAVDELSQGSALGEWSPKASKRLLTDGLIKIHLPNASLPRFTSDFDGVLFDFYLQNVCSGRTILKENTYLTEFLPVLQSSSLSPILALSASHYKDYLQEGSFKRTIENAELRYTVETAKTVLGAISDGGINAPAAAAGALLNHHATLNPSLHPGCWTEYLYEVRDPDGANVEADLIMASVAILARTVLPLSGSRKFQRFQYDWLSRGEERQLTKINANLGLSRMMLYLVYRVMKEATRPNEYDAGSLLQTIIDSRQWVDPAEDDVPKTIALCTAETYKLAAQLFCMMQLFGCLPWHPCVRQTCDELLEKLHMLHTNGEGYSSIHPAWCFVIACACVQEAYEYDWLVITLDTIAGANKSNVDDVCTLVRWMKEWQDVEWQSHGRTEALQPRWWGKQAQYLEGKMKSVICLA